jgi:D-alanyl-D-alanine carboxypeptidase/D-alanyl-D-alanine-endopeptidase (penicillin-binding protein 4)
MTPASTLKLISSMASRDILTDDYVFSTKLYKSTNNDLYLKLGADPFLKNGDLDTLIKTAKNKNITPKNFYIDDTVFDKIEWGEGWQWDDDLNPLMPKFSAYNIDGNLANIVITPYVNNAAPAISVKPYYPITIMNLVNTNMGSANSLKAEHNTDIAPNIIAISGTVGKTDNIKIPVNNTRIYFRLRLENAIKNQKLEYYSPIKYAKTPSDNIYLADEITHDIDSALNDILKNSNNMTAETLFKLAGAKFTNSQGTFENSQTMLNNYLSNLQINSSDIKIVDGSGVSKNNIMTAEFMTEFLTSLAKTDNYDILKTHLPTPGEGTLKNRMLYFKDNLRAKTGTLSDTSAIAGYITTKKGKTYAFDIMIKDAKTSSNEKKNIEEQILRYIYMN